MKTLEIEVTRIDEYKILIDPEVWSEENIKTWASVFFPAENTYDIAEHLCNMIMRLGINHGFFEGFGYIKIFLKNGNIKNQYKKPLNEDDYCKGIEVHLKSYDEEYDYELISEN